VAASSEAILAAEQGLRLKGLEVIGLAEVVRWSRMGYSFQFEHKSKNQK
jgi:hypothetical protein